MVNLSKGDEYKVTAENPGLTTVNVGLNWRDRTDLDVALYALDSEGKLVSGGCASFRLMNIFGGALGVDKDDRGNGRVIPGVPRENARIYFPAIPANIEKVAFATWIYTGAVSFATVEDATVEVRDMSRTPNVIPNTEQYKEAVSKATAIASFKLGGHKTSQSVYLGSFKRDGNGGWVYTPVDEGFIGGLDTLDAFFERGENSKKAGGIFAGWKKRLGI